MDTAAASLNGRLLARSSPVYLPAHLDFQLASLNRGGLMYGRTQYRLNRSKEAEGADVAQPCAP
jgi:hypothetical protein